MSDSRPWVVRRELHDGVKLYLCRGGWLDDVRWAVRFEKAEALGKVSIVATAHPLRVKKAAPAPDDYTPWMGANAVRCILDAGLSESTVTAARRIVARLLAADAEAAHWKAKLTDLDDQSKHLVASGGYQAETIAGLVSERDALRAQVEELAAKYELRCSERAAQWDRATIAEAELATLRSRVVVAESTLVVCKMDLATAIRERDAAVSEGDRQRERAKGAELALEAATAKLRYQATEWSALVEPHNRAVAREAGLQAKLTAVTLELRDEGRARIAAETALGEVTAKAETMRLCAVGWEAQSNRNMNRCGELTRRAEAAESRLAALTLERDALQCCLDRAEAWRGDAVRDRDGWKRSFLDQEKRADSLWDIVEAGRKALAGGGK